MIVRKSKAVIPIEVNVQTVQCEHLADLADHRPHQNCFLLGHRTPHREMRSIHNFLVSFLLPRPSLPQNKRKYFSRLAGSNIRKWLL